MRLRKLGLLIGHDMLNSHPDVEVSDKIFRKYTGLVNSNIIAHEAKGKITLEDALQAVHAVISAHEARIASEGHTKWRGLFSFQFGVDGWRAASSVIHEQADCPSFNAESMSQEWTKIWRPEDPSYDENYFAERCAQVGHPQEYFRGELVAIVISGGSRRRQREEQDSTDGQRLSCVCYADLRLF